MADTEKTYNSTGSATYTFEFEYLKPSDVKVSVAGVPTSEFTIPSSAPTTIQFNSDHIPASDAGVIRIYRDTNVDNLEATFYAGSAIKSQDLNDNFNQNLFVTQEAKRDIATAWQDGDETVNSTEAWYTTDDTKIATTKAIQDRLDLKQNADTDLTNLSNCQTGGSGALAALTQAEIEILDGATVSTTELNYVDGVTSAIQTQLDAKQDEDALLTAISGKSFRTSTDGLLTATDDDEIPSSKVVANHVTSSLSAIGGFIAIANEDSFPNTQPANGVIVSINDAHGITVNSSLTSTSGDCTTVNGTAVTIEGFKSGLQGALPEGNGLIVTSTGADNKYNYHKLLATEADVLKLSDDINDFHSRYRVAASAPASDNDDGDLYWDTSTTDTRKMKVYDGNSGEWIDLVTTGETFINGLTEYDGTGGGSSTFNGTAYRFTLTNHPTGVTAAHHIVSRAGVIQKPNTGTSQPSEGFAIDGHDIIFSSAPANGTNVFVTTLGSALSIGTPADNSVSMAKINATGTASSSTFLRGDGAWEPAAGTITATAAGAIAANKPVGVMNNGRTSEITATHSDIISALQEGDATISTGSVLDLVHDPDSGKVVIFFQVESGSSRIVKYRVATINADNTITFGTDRTAVSGDVPRGFTVCYSTVHNKFILAYVLKETGDVHNIHFKAGSLDSTDNTQINWGTEVEPPADANGEITGQGTSSQNWRFFIAADDDEGTAACLYQKQVTISGTNYYYPYVVGMVTNSSNNNLTINSNNDDSYIYITENNATVGGIAYDTTNNSYVALYKENISGSDGRPRIFDFKIDSTGEIDKSTDYLSNNSSTLIVDSSCNTTPRLAYNPTDNVFVVFYVLNSTHRVYAKAVTFNGSTFTVGSELASSSTNLVYLYGIGPTAYYDSINDQFGLVYHRSDTNETTMTSEWRLVRFKVTAGTTTLTEAVTDTSIYEGSSAVSAGMATVEYVPNSNELVFIVKESNDLDALIFEPKITVELETFIGFSAAAISNSTTGKINVVGNTTTQSGLTAGSTYYVATDGTLSTTAGTPEVLAGIAISSTKLLIK